MGPFSRDGADKTVTVGTKLATRKAQLELLEHVSKSKSLLKSRIIPSVHPKVGKSFHYADLERRKQEILLEARTKILECSKVEAVRDINMINTKLSKKLNGCKNVALQNKVNTEMEKASLNIKKKHDKKVKFHSAKQPKPKSNIESAMKPKNNDKRNGHKQKSREKIVKNRKNYRQRKKLKKKEWIEKKVTEIKESLVINLSSEELPNVVYLYLLIWLKV